MQLPPNITSTGVQLATNAVANVSSVTNVVGNPGIGFRRRIWAVAFVPNSLVHPAHFWFGWFGPSTVNTDNWIKQAGSYPVGYYLAIPGGWLTPENDIIQVQYRSSIAGPQFYHATVWYTTEAV